MLYYMSEKRRKAPIFLSILLVLILSFCVGVSASADEQGGTLVVNDPQEPNTLYSGILSGLYPGMVSAQLYVSPIRFDEKHKPLPYLAKSWDISENNKKITLHLVHNATFHDDHPITSKDVIFSINTVKQYHPFGRQLWGKLDSLTAPDKYTVSIEFNSPQPDIYDALGPLFLPILPEHIFGEVENLRTDPRLQHPRVGSGPYKFVNRIPGRKIILAKYDNFFMEGYPKLDQVVFRVNNSQTEVALALKRGATNIAMMNSPSALSDLEKVKNIRQQDPPYYPAFGCLYWLTFNTESDPVNNEKVRHAIAYAINVKYFVDQLQSGVGQLAPSPIYPGAPFYDDSVPRYTYNPAKARQLLDEAGYPLKDDGTRFTISFPYPNSSPAYTSRVAQAISSQLKDVGIKTDLKSAPDFPTWLDTVANYRFDITIAGVCNYPDPTIGVNRTYLSSNIHKGVPWVNMSQYKNSKVDEILKQAANTADFSKRKKLYSKFQQIVVKDMPIYYMYTLPFINVYQKDVASPPNGAFGLVAPYLDVHFKKQ